MMTKYNNVQEMLDDIGEPEFAEEFRKYTNKPFVRIKKFLLINWALFIDYIFGEK
jgi:hypothetical protein